MTPGLRRYRYKDDAPEGSVVAYGQPPALNAGVGGVVLVTVTPETRRHVRTLLDHMEVV